MIERYERAVAATIVLVAAAVRLLWLDGLPFSTGEAEHGLTALTLVQGHAPQLWSAPALHTVNALSAALFGASELTLRLPSALAGTLAVALVWLFRPAVGAWPALTAMVLLALSPSLVAMSRTVGPEALAQPLLIALVWCGLRYAATGPAWAFNGAAVCAGLLLNLGPGPVTCLLALALVPALAWATGAVAVAGLRQRVPEGIVGLLLAFTLAGSGLLLFPGGFGVPSLALWTRAFEPDAGGGPWYLGLLKLLAYEPPVVLAGTAATVWAVLRPSPASALTRALVVWAAGGAVLLAAMGDRGAWTLLPAALPLTLLAGIGLGRLLERADLKAVQRAALAAPAFAVLAGYLGMALVRQAGTGGDAFLSVAVACLALGIAAVLALAPQNGSRPLPVAGAALLALGAMIALDVHTTARVAFAGGVTEWFDAARPDAAAPETLRLLPLLPAGAAPHLTQPTALSVAGDVGPLVRWHLRDRAAVNYVPELTPGPPVLLGARSGPGRPEVRGYRVRDFPLEAAWRPAEVTPGRLWRWYILRETFGPAPQESRAVLYWRS